MLAKIINNQIVKYPYTITDLKLDNPSVSFVEDERGAFIILSQPEQLRLLNVYTVVERTKPAVKDMEIAQETTPENVNGVWMQNWNVVSKPVEAVDNYRAEKINTIKAQAGNMTQFGGYPVVVNGVKKWFHSDVISRTQQLGLYLMGNNIPVNLQWKTMDGTFVPMTQTLAQQIFTAATLQDIAIFNHSQKLQQDIRTSTNPYAVDITAGWPESYKTS